MGGIFLITVPFGRARDIGWYRVYDKGEINRLLSKFVTVDFKCFVRRNNLWEVCDPGKAERIDSSKCVNAIAFVEALKRKEE